MVGEFEGVEVDDVDVDIVELAEGDAMKIDADPDSSSSLPFLRKQPRNPNVTQSSDSQSTRAGASIAASTG
jgi:hypothetical protein